MSLGDDMIFVIISIQLQEQYSVFQTYLQAASLMGGAQGCIGGNTRVYAVYLPLVFFDSVYLPHLS